VLVGSAVLLTPVIKVYFLTVMFTGCARIFAEKKPGPGSARPVEREEKALAHYNLAHWH
jgi:hypothetical protein